jgi:hypothetical protein
VANPVYNPMDLEAGLAGGASGDGTRGGGGGGGHGGRGGSDVEGRRVTEWLERRPGALYEDLIEEYSRASVSAWAIMRLFLGWLVFVLDPAAGLLILDGARLLPRANQRLEADLALHTLQHARGHAGAELQVFAACGAILGLMLWFYIEHGGVRRNNEHVPAHAAFLFWLTAALLALQLWRSLGAATRFLRVQREVMVGDSWARWLDTPVAGSGKKPRRGSKTSGTEPSRWEGASAAVAQAAGTRASGARRFHGDGFVTPPPPTHTHTHTHAHTYTTAAAATTTTTSGTHEYDHSLARFSSATKLLPEKCRACTRCASSLSAVVASHA